MPTVTKANGGTADRFNAVGRSVFQYELASTGMNTTPYAVDSNFEKIVRAAMQWGSVEMVGQQGIDAAGGASVTKVTLFMSGNEDGVHPVSADMTAVLTGAANNCTVTLIATYNAQGAKA